jgi:hypothetical protein
MKYIKSYEGFKPEQLKIIKTSVFKSDYIGNNNLLSDSIKSFDINNFKINTNHGYYEIYPDEKFLKLYKDYCDINSFYYEKIKFNCSVLEKDLITGCYNLIDSEELIPNNLQGLSLGSKIYKLLCNELNFIMSVKENTDKAKNLWFKLLIDDELYCGTNDDYNIIINKNIPDETLFDIIDKVDDLKLIYDDDLSKKIKNRC